MTNDHVIISITVPKFVETNLARRAAPLNIRVNEYARRLFDAAYAARIAGERGQESGDRDLDRQVRDVFLLADCEPDYIADALGLPVERVSKMLNAWRQVAREKRETPNSEVAAPVMPQPSLVSKKARSDGYTDAQVEVIGTMWRAGKSVREIATTIERPVPGLQNWVARHRDVCPLRRGGER